MARADWKPYYTPIFDPPAQNPVYFRVRRTAVRYGKCAASTFEPSVCPLKLIGIAAVIGKEPSVQKWFAENHCDRWER